MSFYNGILNHEDNHGSGQIGPRGLPGIGFKVGADGNYDIENKKLTNVKNGDMDHDVMVKSQIEGYVSNKTQYLDGVNPGQVINNKAVIYSNSGSIHSNALYLKDQYGQEVNVHTEDQDDNQICLYIPNLKNNDSFGGRLKSSLVITSIEQTIEGKKIFSDIHVPSPTLNNQASNKQYVDTNFLNRLTGGQIGGDLDMRGHSIKYLKLDHSDSAAARVSELNLKADKSDLDDYFKLDGTKAMTGNLNMDNNRITKLRDPVFADEPATLGYVSQLNNNLFNSCLDLAGVRKMTGNLQMNHNQITGLTNIPNADDHASNKRYVDASISKGLIKPSHTPKNVFKYLMNDVNEWSTEYNIKVGSFSDLAESPHNWNKRVLNINPIKDGNNYRFRLGLQMFPLQTNSTYSIIIELFNRDYKTWLRQQTFVEGTGIWVKSHNTTKFQHHYDSNGVLYYTKTLIKFKKTSSTAPIFVYFTIHYDDKGGDMNTYPSEFKNQVYILAYGIIGETDHVDSEVYDKHEAFEIDKNKMKMLVPLDMNNKSIKNISNLSMGGLIFIHGKINYTKKFTVSNIQISFGSIYISYIKLWGSYGQRSASDVLKIIDRHLNETRYPFKFPHMEAGSI